MTFLRAVAFDDLGPGEMLGCRVGGRRVLLARVGQTVYAYEDRCAHLGVPLSEGKRNGTRLMCHAHYWEYELTTGCGIDPSSVCLVRFPVRVEDGAVFVDVEAEDPPVGQRAR
jgi:toluene monooxygenase system ferredoxin subunit